jgi:flagellar basal-body rod modification protein FlgD
MAMSQAEGLIGRTVTSDDGTVTGTVAGIRVISGGAVAILEDGRQVLLGAGVTVS